MSQDIHIVTVVLPNALASNDIVPLLQAPTDAIGGGITLDKIAVVNYPASDDQGAATAFALQFLKYSSAGTPAVNGTVGSVGGTATPLAKGVPQSIAPSSANFLDAGEWLYVKYTESAATNPSQCAITLQYSMGK